MANSDYNSRLVDVTFAGIPLARGRDVDEFLTIEPVEAETHTMEVAEDGSVVSSQSGNRAQIVTLKLKQGSPEHGVLSAILLGDIATPGGKGIGALGVIDGNGVSTLAEPEARLQGWPKKAYGSKADKVMEWKFLCPSPARFDGGL